MKLSPVHMMFWTCVLVLCICRSETLHTDLCQDESLYGRPLIERYERNSAGEMQQVYDYNDGCDDVDDGSCLLYPTRDLNCSWTFCSSTGKSSASVIICDKENISSWNCVSEGDGSKTKVLCHGRVNTVSSVILRVNVSLPDVWTVHTGKHDAADIEVLRPPPNISVLFSEGGLLVRWGVPNSQTTYNCFDFQLDINGQEPKNLNEMEKLEYPEPNADPTLAYKVRIRTQKSKHCGEPQHWSEWSHTVVLAPTESPNKLSPLVIASITFGIPMILLALLLLYRSQRMSTLLFQPVPRPPLRYQQFLEKHDAFQSFPPVQSPTYTEEFIEVEEAEEAPRKTQAPNS